MKKFIAILCAVLVLSSCSTLSRSQSGEGEVSENSSGEVSNQDSAEGVSGETQVSTNSGQSENSETSVETYPDYPVSYPEIEQQETGEIYEAEKAELAQGLSVLPENADGENSENSENSGNSESSDGEETENKGYSGDGYVTGFSADGSRTVRFTAKAPTTQHYDISFSISAESEVNCDVIVNGETVSNFNTKSNGKFTLITIYGIFLSQGDVEVTIIPHGDVKLDYMKFSNDTSLSNLSYKAEADTNNGRSEQAQKLMTFFHENYGEYMISGQYAENSDNKELELVYNTTGKYPVIRFSALHNKGDSFEDYYDNIQASADWYDKGGIAGLMWYWEAPGEKRSVYSEETDFSLSAVMDSANADESLDNLAQMSPEELMQMYGEGRISKDLYGLMSDLDNMAGLLKSLKDKGVPVLWRPLHEAYGDWFWWGADGAEAYNWLWNLMYDRFTKYYSLDNLIWVWNGQSAGTLVDINTFDIASLDIYLDSEKSFDSRYEQFVSLQKIVGGGKLLALSECSEVPDADLAFRDNSVWLFYGLWYGEYLQDESGNYSEKYCPKEDFIKNYNSDGVLTLDEYMALNQ